MAKRGVMYKPTDPDRAFVIKATMAGRPQKNLAACLKIDEKTLTKHYRYELLTSREIMCGDAAGCIHEAVRDGSVDAAKYVLARAAGWMEKSAHEVSGADGGPIPVQFVTPDQYTQKEWEKSQSE